MDYSQARALTLRSPSFTLPSLNRKILALLISLWAILALCSASIPSSKCLKMCQILLSFMNYLSPLACSILEARSPESASSITMHNYPSASSKNASL